MQSVRVRFYFLSADTGHSFRGNPYTLYYTIHSFSPRKNVGYVMEEPVKSLANYKDELASRDAALAPLSAITGETTR